MLRIYETNSGYRGRERRTGGTRTLRLMLPAAAILQRAGGATGRMRGRRGGPLLVWLAVTGVALAVALLAGRRVTQPR
jgi:hypothetical protein